MLIFVAIGSFVTVDGQLLEQLPEAEDSRMAGTDIPAAVYVFGAGSAALVSSVVLAFLTRGFVRDWRARSAQLDPLRASAASRPFEPAPLDEGERIAEIAASRDPHPNSSAGSPRRFDQTRGKFGLRRTPGESRWQIKGHLVPARGVYRRRFMPGVLILVVVFVASAVGVRMATTISVQFGLVLALGTPAVFAAVWLGGAGLRLIGRGRDRTVAQIVGDSAAVVFASNRTARSNEVLASTVGDGPVRLSHEFSVVLGADGLSIWDGPAREPSCMATISWHLVSGVQVGRVRSESSTGLGLRVSLRDTKSIEFQPVGGGFMGVFSLPAAEVEELAAQLDRMRVANAAP